MTAAIRTHDPLAVAFFNRLNDWQLVPSPEVLDAAREHMTEPRLLRLVRRFR
jgi:hypothetical protein